MERAALAALEDALRSVGASTQSSDADSADRRPDLEVVTPDGRRLLIEVKAGSVVTPAQVREWLRRSVDAHAARVVVADLISRPAREELRAAGWGWLDRRGHLRLVAPGVWVDREIEPMPRARHGTLLPTIRGASGFAVASAALLWPEDLPGVRELAGRVHLSPTAISTSRRALIAAGLLSDDGGPAVPELFWALAGAWSPQRVRLARVPEPDPLLVVTGTAAAVALDAPIVATADYPVDLLAGDERVYRRARLRGGEGGPGHAATLALTPTALALDSELTGAAVVHGVPTTHPLFVALDLAADPARGAEVLEAWEPEGFRRVW